MTLDTLTLFTCVTIATISSSIVLCLLALAMRHQPGQIRFGTIIWAASMLIIGIGCSLISLRGTIPDMVSIILANSLLLMGQGLRPNAIAVFHRRQPLYFWLPILAISGWLALCSYPPFRDSYLVRVAYVQAGFIFSSLLSIWAALRLDRKALASSRILVGTLVMEACGYGFFTYSQLSLPGTNFITAYQTGPMSIYLLVVLWSGVLGTVMIAAMGIEDMQRRLKRDAHMDPLTGLPNRRSFEQGMRRELRRHADEPIPFTLTVVELDDFAALQDLYGEAMGEALLRLFSRICRDSLPANAVAGRIGPQRFALFMPLRSETATCALARGISRTFTTAARQASGGQMTATLSTGIFAGDSRTKAIRAWEIADRCVVRAKAGGNNHLVVNETDKTAPLRSSRVTAPFSTSQRSAA